MVWICYNHGKWLVNATFFGSKGQRAWPLEQLASKLHLAHYLKKYLSGRYETFRIVSNRHSGVLIKFWGLGSVNFLSSRGTENWKFPKSMFFSISSILHHSKCMKWLYNGYASWLCNHCGYVAIVIM